MQVVEEYSPINSLNNDKVSKFRNIIGGAIGNVLEWYDFAIFGYFSVIISQLFFSGKNPALSLILTFGIFAAGFLMRPIGGILLGHIADKYGRKKTLIISVALIGIVTTFMGLLPTYASIGIGAPIILIILRMLQGLAVGGEFVGSITYMTEMSENNQQTGFWGSLSFVSSIGGILLGSLVAMCVHFFLTGEELKAWGWRIPFLICLILTIFSLWMRKGIDETSPYQKIPQNKLSSFPIKDVICAQWKTVLMGCGLTAMLCSNFYAFFVWWPTFIHTSINIPMTDCLKINTQSMIILVMSIFISGRLLLKWSFKKQLILSILLICAFILPLFYFTLQGGLNVEIMQGIMAILMGFYISTIPVTLCHLFSTEIRVSGVGMSYNIAMSLLGGTIPILCSSLITYTGNYLSVVAYLTVIGLITLTCAFFLKSKNNIITKF